MGQTGTPIPYALTERLERARQLDAVSGVLSRVVSRALPAGPVREVAEGRFLGHALHPLLTDVPIGAWTSSLVLDLVGGSASEPAADLLIAVGVAAALPTAVTGWADWSGASVEQRRVGIVHAASNVLALSLFAVSLRHRMRRERARGKLLSLAASGALGVGGYLGGHLAYARGVGVEARAPSSAAAPSRAAASG
jgi:uncharacterized membrane protein